MKLDYRVHTLAPGSVSREITMDDGETAQAVQPGVTVELVPVSGAGSSISLQLTDAFLAKNKGTDLFENGGVVELHFVKGGK